MMQRKLLMAALAVLSLPACLWADPAAPYVKIHHIGVGHGDCTLIIAVDRDAANNWRAYTVLIDVGEPNTDRTNAIFETVVDDIGRCGVADAKLNYVVISHYHFDHMGGMQAYLEKLASDNRTKDWVKDLKVIDRLGYAKKKGSDPLKNLWAYSFSFPDKTGAWHPTANGALNKYLGGKTYKVTRDPAWLGSNLFGWPYTKDTLRNIRMHCVTANGCVDWKNPAVKAYSPKLRKGRKVARSENDLSFSFLLQLDGFRYFTGGDLGGENGRYTNMETPIVEFFRDKLGIAKGGMHFCAWKVNHHGSNHSLNPDFAEYFQPTLSVIPAFLRVYGSKPLPRDEVINRLLSYSETIGGTRKTLIAQPTWVAFTFTTAADVHAVNKPYLLTRRLYSDRSTPEYSKRSPDKYCDVILEVARPVANVAMFANGPTPTPIEMKVTTRERSTANCIPIGTAVSTTLTCARSHVRYPALGYPNP